MIDDDGTTTIPDARINATAPPDTNQPVNRTEGVSRLNIQLQASIDPSHRHLGSTHGIMSTKTTRGTSEDETTMIPNDMSTTMSDKPTAETVTGNAIALPCSNYLGYSAEEYFLLRPQLQSSSDFYDALPAPVHHDSGAMVQLRKTFEVPYDAHRAKTNEAPLGHQVGDLADRLMVCEAFKTLPIWTKSHLWDCVHYRIIATNIVSVLRRQVLGPRFSSHHSYGGVIQITVCTLENRSRLLRAAFASASESLQRGELNNILQTSLYLAATYGCACAARTLIDLGADPDVTYLSGETCRDVARDQNHGEIVALLEHRDAAEGARRASTMDVAGDEATEPDPKTESGTDVEKPGRTVDIGWEGSAGSGPFSLNKWFDTVVMPWSQRNWDSLGSSFSMGNFRVKLHSWPTSK